METTKKWSKVLLAGMFGTMLAFGIVFPGYAEPKKGSAKSKVVDYFAEGFAYAQAGELDKALKSLANEIAKNPTNARAYYIKGQVYRDKQEYVKALSDLAQVVVIVPTDTELVASSYFVSGECYWKQKDFKTAILWYTKALTLFPEHEPFLLRRGIAYYFDGDYENAIKDGEEILAINGKLNSMPDKQCLSLLASAYSKLGDAKKAELYGLLSQ